MSVPNVRVRVIGAWALSMILCFLFLNLATPKLTGQAGWMQRFQEWGYSSRFASGIGMLELLGAGLVLLPSLASYGAAILAVIMLGAIYTHLSTGLGSPAFAVQLLLLALALVALRYPDARRLH